MPCTIHLLFHFFFIILSSETSLPLFSFFLSSVLLHGCQSHGNHFLPLNQPQNKKHTHKNKQTNKMKKTQTKEYNHKNKKNKKTHNHRRDEERTNKVKKNNKK
jgi:hypothetical protein